MKNKNGFTLIEIIAVISLLSVISLLGSISFNNIAQKEKNKKLIETKEMIITATDVYLNKYSYLTDNLYNGTETSLCTKIYKLQDEGLIQNDIKNPKTNKYIQGSLCVVTTIGVDNTLVHNFEFE